MATTSVLPSTHPQYPIRAPLLELPSGSFTQSRPESQKQPLSKISKTRRRYSESAYTLESIAQDNLINCSEYEDNSAQIPSYGLFRTHIQNRRKAFESKISKQKSKSDFAEENLSGWNLSKQMEPGELKSKKQQLLAADRKVKTPLDFRTADNTIENSSKNNNNEYLLKRKYTGFSFRMEANQGSHNDSITNTDSLNTHAKNDNSSIQSAAHKKADENESSIQHIKDVTKSHTLWLLNKKNTNSNFRNLTLLEFFSKPLRPLDSEEKSNQKVARQGDSHKSTGLERRAFEPIVNQFIIKPKNEAHITSYPKVPSKLQPKEKKADGSKETECLKKRILQNLGKQVVVYNRLENGTSVDQKVRYSSLGNRKKLQQKQLKSKVLANKENVVQQRQQIRIRELLEKGEACASGVQVLTKNGNKGCGQNEWKCIILNKNLVKEDSDN